MAEGEISRSLGKLGMRNQSTCLAEMYRWHQRKCEKYHRVMGNMHPWPSSMAEGNLLTLKRRLRIDIVYQAANAIIEIWHAYMAQERGKSAARHLTAASYMSIKLCISSLYLHQASMKIKSI